MSGDGLGENVLDHHRCGHDPKHTDSQLQQNNTLRETLLVDHDQIIIMYNMFTKTSFGRTEDRGATLNRGCVSFCFVASNFWMCAEVAGGITFGILAGTLSAMLTESNASQQEAQEQVGLYSTLLYSLYPHCNQSVKMDPFSLSVRDFRPILGLF
jgi:hypothetical protein